MISSQLADQGKEAEELQRPPAWDEIVKTPTLQAADPEQRLQVFNGWVADERSYMNGLQGKDPEAYAKWKESESDFNKRIDQESDAILRSGIGEIQSRAATFMQGWGDIGTGVLRSVAALMDEPRRVAQETMEGVSKNNSGIVKALADTAAMYIRHERILTQGLSNFAKDQAELVSSFWGAGVKGRMEGEDTPMDEKIIGALPSTIATMATGGVAGTPAMLTLVGLMSFGGNIDSKYERLKQANPDMGESELRNRALAGSAVSAGLEVGLTAYGSKLLGTLESQALGVFKSRAAKTAAGSLTQAAQKFDPVSGKVLEVAAEKIPTGLIKNFFSAKNLATIPSEIIEENLVTASDFLVDQALGLKDRDLGKELYDTTIISAVTAGTLGAGQLHERGTNVAKIRKNLSSYADGVLAGTDPVLQQYKEIGADSRSGAEVGFAASKVDHMVDRAHWIKQELGDTEGVDLERAARYVNVTEAAAKRASYLEEKISGIKELLSQKADVSSDAETVLGPEIGAKLRETDKAIADKALEDALSELSNDPEKQRLDDEFILAKFAPADIAFASPKERAAAAKKTQDILYDNAGADLEDVRALVKAEFASTKQAPTPEGTGEQSQGTTPPVSQETSEQATTKINPAAPEPAVTVEPAPEMIGRRGRFEGYEGIVAKDGERFILATTDGSEVELPANAEVEPVIRPVPAARDTAIPSPAPEGDVIQDFQVGRQVEAARPNPALDGANEISKAALDRPEVQALDLLTDIPVDETLDEDGLAVARGAKMTLEKGIRDIETRERLTDAEKTAAAEPLYAKLIALDESLAGRGLDLENTPDQDMVARGRELGINVARDTDESLATPVEPDNTEDAFARLREIRDRMVAANIDPAPVDAKITELARNPKKAAEIVPPRKPKKAAAAKKGPRGDSKGDIADDPAPVDAKITELARNPKKAAEVVPPRKNPNAGRKIEPLPEKDNAKVFSDSVVASLAEVNGQGVAELEAQYGEQLRKMANTVAKFVQDRFAKAGMGDNDALIQEAIIDSLYGAAAQRDRSGTGIRQNVLTELVENFRQNGDPFLASPSKSTKKASGELAKENAKAKSDKPVQYSHKGAVLNAIKPVILKWAASSATRGGQSLDAAASDDSTDTVESKVDAEMAGQSDTLVERPAAREARREQYSQVHAALDSYVQKFGDEVLRLDRYARQASGLGESEIRASVSDALNSVINRLAGGLGDQILDPVEDALVSPALRDAILQDGAKLLPEIAAAVKKSLTTEESLEGVEASVDVSSPEAFLESVGRGLAYTDTQFLEAVNAAQTADDLSGLLAQMNAIPAVRAQLGLIAQSQGIKLQPDGTPEATDSNRIRLLSLAKSGEVLNDPSFPAPVKAAIIKLTNLYAKNKEAQFTNPGEKALFTELLRQNADLRNNLKVVFDPLMLTPTEPDVSYTRGYWLPAFDLQTGQQLLEGPDSAIVYVSPYLQAKDRNAIVLHEGAHAVLDTKITRFLAGQLHLLTDVEIESLKDLFSLLAQTRAAVAKATDLDEHSKLSLERATASLSEFVSEVWGDQRVRDFMAGIKTPKGSLVSRAVRRIIQLFTGRRNVARDSLLARTLDTGLKLAATRSPLQIREVMAKDAAKQAEFFVKRTGLTPDQLFAAGHEAMFDQVADEYRAHNARLSEATSDPADLLTIGEREVAGLPAASVNISFSEARNRKLSSVIRFAVPENAKTELFGEADYDKALAFLVGRINDPAPVRVRRNGKSASPATVNMRTPDESTALYRKKGEDPFTARAHHVLTDQTDRLTPSPSKIRLAGAVIQTLQQADFVGSMNFEDSGEPTTPRIYYAKLYNDPESPTGTRWHVVTSNINGEFITQNSFVGKDLKGALKSQVVGVGDPSPTEEFGYAQDVSGADLQGIEPLDREGAGGNQTTDPAELQQKILDEVDALTAKRNRLLAAGQYDLAAKVSEQIASLEDSFDATQGSTATSDFTPTTFGAEQRARTGALARARAAHPEVARALEKKTYFAWSQRETVDQARAFIASKGGDLYEAFRTARPGLATGLSPEQVHAVQALALRGLNEAAAAIGVKLNSAADLGSTRGDLEIARQVYRSQADEVAEALAEQASQAGSELRAFRTVADLLAPQQWVRMYKQATNKGMARNKPVIRVLERALDQARKEARNNMLGRMKKVIEAAGARFLPADMTEDEKIEYRASQKLAHLVGSPLPIREQIARAAAETAAAGAVGRIRKILAGSPVEETLLGQIQKDVVRLAREQTNAAIEARLGEEGVELTEEQKQAQADEKIRDLWREVGKLPLAEQVFNSAIEAIRQYAPKEAGVLSDAKFDAARSSAIRKAVDHSIVLSDEIRKSVGERGATVETLVAQLKAANPSLDPEFSVDNQDSPLSQTAYEKIAAAVEAVYNEEVRKAMESSMDRIIQQDRDAKFMAKKVDRTTIQRLLPYVNLGGMQREEVYNILAEKFKLPKWNPATVEQIREEAEALQQLPEGSIMRDEAAQKLGLTILKAHIKDSGGIDKVRNYLDIAGLVWTAGVLSGPPTQFVNATATAGSVFLETLVQATANSAVSLRDGAGLSKSLGFYKDAMEAWRFAFGKTDYGTRRWLTEGVAALTKGTTRFKSEKQEELSPLEIFKYDPDKKFSLNSYLSTMKYVGRAMLASDGVNSMIADNAKRRMMLRALAIEAGKTDEEIAKIVDGPNAEDIKAANEMITEEKAAGQIKTKLDEDQRREQILEGFVNDRMGLDAAVEVKQNGRDFAAFASYNNDAYGLVGMVLMETAARLNRLSGGLSRPLVPFPRTVSNLINSSISYTPYGFARAANLNPGRLFTSDEYKQTIDWDTREGRIQGYAMIARATAGSTALVILAGLISAAFRDREEGKVPFVEVVGNGPSDPADRKQWLASGFKPFHIRIGGAQLRYTDWPAIGIVLGAMGTAYDRMADGDSEETLQEKAWSGVVGAVATVFDRNMLSGASELFKVINESATDQQREVSLKRLTSSYVSGFTHPQLFRWFGQIVTGKVNEGQSDKGWLLSMTPLTWLRDKPVLNILGEPVEAKRLDVAFGRFGSPVREHPILTPLSNAGVVLPIARKEKVVDPATGKARAFTDEEWYDYQKAFGQSLKEQLSDPDYLRSLTEMEPDMAEDTVKDLGSAARLAAREATGLQPAPRK